MGGIDQMESRIASLYIELTHEYEGAKDMDLSIITHISEWDLNLYEDLYHQYWEESRK